LLREIVCRKAKGLFMEGECLVVAILEATEDKSVGETAQDYSAGTSVIYFQIFFQFITEEGVPSRGGV